ncbi:plasmid stabilization protein [Priestia megaterium]|uniref:plasmid stabilization protein n=1 Tax=Priestia megaterium TaxID=1404 RepID=UPI0023DC6C87|nr:plasmid stabilization protein [Priestia megaterium]MDF2053497.1 plasmid stabilization protein [Priestia megaterium]MDF2062899.1 plasmid stabilization protein [Priestia megaterium]
MPHKITLTGSATGPLREYDRYVAFDMREKGSPSAPKGLKKSTFISYTVFVAKKEPKQEASAPSETQKNTESTKQEEEQAPVSQPVVKEEKKEVKPIQPEVQQAPAEEKKTTLSNQPKGTQDLLNFDDIIVPEEFLKTRPNPEKTQKVIDFVKRTGRLDEPLTIEKGSKILKDGYRRYVVAKTVKMDQVPVVYEYQK